MNITHEDQQTHITNELLDPIKEVAKFHSAFNQVDGKKPQLLDILHWTLRKELGQEELREVQRSNMSKLDENKKPIVNGENGIMDTTRPTGKILKSEFFVEPDLKKFL